MLRRSPFLYPLKTSVNLRFSKLFFFHSLHRSACDFKTFTITNMPFKRKTEKKSGFPFLKTRSFKFQPLWNNLSQTLGVIYEEFGPLPIRIKNVICFEDFKMILLLQNFANLKISPCNLD